MLELDQRGLSGAAFELRQSALVRARCLLWHAEVEEVGDDYKVGGPEDWKWPPGRTDQWGVSNRDNERIGAAERNYPWS